MLNNWRGAWNLVKFEMARSKLSLLFVLFAIMYFILFVLPMLLNALDSESHVVSKWAVDFLCLTLLPIMGVINGKLQLQYWKTDFYSRKVAMWRIKPISCKQIVLARFIQVIIGSLIVQIPFYTAFYFMAKSNNLPYSISSVILFGLIWYFISISISYFVIYLELGYTGKQYTVLYFIFMAIMMVAILAYTLSLKFSIIVWSLQELEAGKWWLTIIAALIAACVYIPGEKLLINKMKKRDFIS